MSATAEIKASFHRTRGGLLAARLNEMCFLAAVGRDGVRIAYGSGLKASLDLWVRQDFYGAGRLVDGEAGFRAYVEEQVVHFRELADHPRPDLGPGADTPWGVAETSRGYAEGVIKDATAGHGGFHLDPTRNAAINPAWRNDDGWYEEDCQWAKVAVAFPDLFTEYERRCANERLRHYEPDAYECINGVTLKPGESYNKDKRQFARDHAADWIVISAIRSRLRTGFVECVAKIGGDRRAAQERRFLIPKVEYEIGPFGFVIDPARHAEYYGASDFIGGVEGGS